MKKISKLILVVAVLALALSAFAVSANAEIPASVISAMAAENFYVGELTEEQGGYGAGQTANVFFGQAVDIMTPANVSERGVKITNDATAEEKYFKAENAGSLGKFGVAIYNMPEGVYTATLMVNGEATTQTIKFVANVGLATQIRYNWGNGADIAGEDEYNFGYAIEGEPLLGITPADAEGVVLPANATIEGWYKEDGTKWDLKNDVYDGSFTTLYAKYVPTEDLSSKMFAPTFGTAASGGQWAFGNSTAVDISDGSTLVMEFDITETSGMGAVWYFFWYINGTDNNHATEYQHYHQNIWSARNATSANYNVGNIIKNDLTTAAADKTGVTVTGWDPDAIIVKDQSVRFAYTAPTETTQGSMIIYTKHVVDGENGWVAKTTVSGLNLNCVQRTDMVYMGIQIQRHTSDSTFKFTNYKNYVIKAEDSSIENVPGFNASKGTVPEVENNYVRPLSWEGTSFNWKAVEAASQSINVWMGNSMGVNLDEGESLTWEFTINGKGGMWYNIWGGFMVYSSDTFATTLPMNFTTKAIGFYANYSGKTCNIIGSAAMKSGAACAEGYATFDPYTDIYITAPKTQRNKLVYVAPTSTTAGSLSYYTTEDKGATGEYVLQTKIENITGTEVMNNVHMSWFWYQGSSGYASVLSKCTFDMTDFTMYTSNGKNITPILAAGGDSVITQL